jgi:hypothetical protein
MTVQRDFGRIARWWIRLDTSSAASGPTDPTIPATRVVTEEALGLGFCVPFRTAEPSGVRTVAAWRIDGSGTASPVPLASLPSAPADLDHGALYAPPPSTPPDPTATPDGSVWSPGRYVFAVTPVTPGAAADWFAVDIEHWSHVAP